MCIVLIQTALGIIFSTIRPRANDYFLVSFKIIVYVYIQLYLGGYKSLCTKRKKLNNRRNMVVL